MSGLGPGSNLDISKHFGAFVRAPEGRVAAHI